VERILITGGAGFIGHHFVSKLLHQGQYRIIVVDNLSTGNKENLFGDESESVIRGAHLSFYEENILNTDRIFDIFKHEGVDTCIHLAAKTSVLDSATNPYCTVEVNIKGTLNILEACYRYRVKNFIFASSAAVYGEPHKLPISEEDPLRPLSTYGASKVAGEALVSSYGNTGKIENAVSLRIFNVYGEGQSSDYAGVITAFIDRLSRRLPPIIYGDGTQTRDFVYVLDIVDAIILAAKRFDRKKNSEPLSSSVFNIGTGMQVSIRDLAMKMVRLFGLKLNPLYRKKISNEDIRRSCADISKSKKKLKFNIAHDLDQGLTQFLRPPGSQT
jgi:UDP-glucose 4-epimerase